MRGLNVKLTLEQHMLDNFDFTNTLIKEGDWLVMRGTSSVLPPLRFAKVLRFGTTGKPIVRAFQTRDGTSWVRSSYKPMTLQVSHNCWAIDAAMLPTALLKHIKEDLGGDTEFFPEDAKAKK